MEKKYQKQSVPSFSKGNVKAQRRVPPLVALSVLFNNIFGYMGLSFAALGMIFAVVFTPAIDFKSPFYFGDNAVTTTGIVTEVNSTNAEVNDDPVFEYKFTFEYMGRFYSGVSYSSGHNYSADQNVPVEFEPDNPSIARIENMSMKPFDLIVLLGFLFPLVGFAFIYISLRKGVPAVHAVKYGIITRGKFLRKEPTGGSINDMTIYDFYFSFKNMSGNDCTAKGSTHKVWLVQDEPDEMVIYDPDDPSNAVVVDALPGSVKKFLTSERGQATPQ